jgi:17-hydroxy-3-oxo-4-pregnene-20-carboxyl-CoA lyase
MTDSFRGKVAVAGVGETDYSRNSGRSELTLSLQAIHAALEDCGLTAKDVDGLLRWQVDTSSEAEVAASLGVKELRYFGDITQAGNVGAALVANASAAINAGLADVIVIYRGMNGRSGRRYGRGDVTGRGGAGEGQFSEPFGVLVPQHRLAMMTRRRMYETGVTSLHFAATASTIRAHANRNPRATFYETPLSIEDHQNSRFVVEPLHLFDCCLETDGAGALVLTSADRARTLRKAPAYIRAAVQTGYVRDRNHTDTSAISAGPRVFAQAGMTPSDVDVVQIYDHFCPFVIFALEDYGFVNRGEGGEFVAAGEIRWDKGLLPVNTSGGHLSEAYMQGMNQLIEGVRQVRGESTAQVSDVEVSFVDTGLGTGAAIFTKEA